MNKAKHNSVTGFRSLRLRLVFTRANTYSFWVNHPAIMNYRAGKTTTRFVGSNLVEVAN